MTARLVPLAAVIALVAGVGNASAMPTATTIARASAVDFRVSVTATKDSGGAAPTAAVNVVAFEKTGSTWKPLGHVAVGRPGGLFWKVVTGPRA